MSYQLESKMSNRNQAIQKLNEYFDDLKSPFTAEHRLVIESHILGFNTACKTLEVFSDEEHTEVQNMVNNYVNTGIKPAFLDDIEVAISLADAKKYLHDTARDQGRHLDTALDCLNQLISQKIEFPTAIGLVLDEYNVDQAELTAAYDNQ